MANLNINIAIDDEIISDYRENLIDQYEVAANAIQQLENDPGNADAIHTVFRALHTIKGNSNLCQLDILTKFCHAVEEIAVGMRQGEIDYTPVLGELILLSLDKTKEVSEDLFNKRKVDSELLSKIEDILLSISQQPKQELASKAVQVISLITNQSIDQSNLDSYGFEKLVVPKAGGPIVPDPIIPKDNVESLEFFKKLSLLLENKIPFWKGRIDRTLPLAIELNRQMGTPEDPTQLTAAVYMHDIAFAFLDDRFWNNQTKFNLIEMEMMHQHPSMAAKLLDLVPGWQDAKHIVLQHHEWWNGAGYPNGINGDKIRSGAQLLAVIDAFESMTHERPDRQFKRSILRAMTEINNCSGSQFSPHITSLFNSVVRDTLVHRNKKS